MVSLLNLPAYQASPLLDLSPINQALQYQQKRAEVQQARDMHERQFAEGQRQFNASFGLQQRQADRADELAPLQLDNLKTQIANARASGAREAELFPMVKQARELELKLTQSKVEGKDSETQLLRSLGLTGGGAVPGQPVAPGPAPQQPILQPQSYDGGNGDPNLILTADGGQTQPQAQPQTPAQPGAADVIKGMSPAQKAQFGLSYIGKGDAAKVLGDAAEKDRIGKEGMNKIDEEIIAKIGDLSELDNIKKRYRPEFLEIGGRVKAMGTSWQAYLNSGSVKPEDKKFLSDYTRFAAASQERMNTRIKAMSGSAVSGHEEVRLNKANPTVSDDPVTYEAKLNEQIQLQRSAVSRYMWLKNVRGMTHDQISNLAKSGKIESLAGLDDMRGIVDQRGAQLEQELQSRGVPPDRIQGVVRQRLKQEFGI